jgi:hypothetical protein
MKEAEQFKYTNRAGKEITFTYTGNGQDVVMSDYGPYIRMGYHTDNKKEIDFIDPSGGPFIFRGMNFSDIIHGGKLKPFLDDPFNRIVTKITNDLLGITITFKKEEKKKKP